MWCRILITEMGQITKKRKINKYVKRLPPQQHNGCTVQASLRDPGGRGVGPKTTQRGSGVLRGEGRGEILVKIGVKKEKYEAFFKKNVLLKESWGSLGGSGYPVPYTVLCFPLDISHTLSQGNTPQTTQNPHRLLEKVDSAATLLAVAIALAGGNLRDGSIPLLSDGGGCQVQKRIHIADMTK